MAIEYVIEGIWEFGKNLAVDIPTDSYTKAVFIEIPVSGIKMDVINEAYDRAIASNMAIASIKIDSDVTKDWATQFAASVLMAMRIDASPGITKGIELAVQSQPMSLKSSPGVDRSTSLEAELAGLFLEDEAVADRAVSAEVIAGTRFGLDLTYLMRSILTIPPKGYITIGEAIEEGSILLLDSAIRSGYTNIFYLNCDGTRLDAYLIEFEIRINPNDRNPIVRKSSARNEGGITLVSPPETAPISTTVLQTLIAQIVLEPDDLAFLLKTQVVYYTCRMSQEGMGENYLIESGKFAVIVE